MNIKELADRMCEPAKTFEPVTPVLEGLVFEVYESSISQHENVPYLVIPQQFCTAESIESEFDCYACWRAVEFRTGNEWESLEGPGYRVAPEQGTLYVRQQDLIKKVGEVYAEYAREAVWLMATRGIIECDRTALSPEDIQETIDSFRHLYLDE